MSNKAMKEANKNGQIAFISFGKGTSDNDDAIYKPEPTGGVNKPIVKLILIITPK